MLRTAHLVFIQELLIKDQHMLGTVLGFAKFPSIAHLVFILDLLIKDQHSQAITVMSTAKHCSSLMSTSSDQQALGLLTWLYQVPKHCSSKVSRWLPSLLGCADQRSAQPTNSSGKFPNNIGDQQSQDRSERGVKTRTLPYSYRSLHVSVLVGFYCFY